MGTRITVYRHRAEIRFKVQHGPWKVRLFRTNSGGNGLLSMTADGEWVEHRAGLTDAAGTVFDRWSGDNVIAARQLAMRLGFEGCVAIDGDAGRTPWWTPKSKVAACTALEREVRLSETASHAPQLHCGAVRHPRGAAPCAA